MWGIIHGISGFLAKESNKQQHYDIEYSTSPSKCNNTYQRPARLPCPVSTCCNRSNRQVLDHQIRGGSWWDSIIPPSTMVQWRNVWGRPPWQLLLGQKGETLHLLLLLECWSVAGRHPTGTSSATREYPRPRPLSGPLVWSGGTTPRSSHANDDNDLLLIKIIDHHCLASIESSCNGWTEEKSSTLYRGFIVHRHSFIFCALFSL
jgi:hypothetical protein